MGKRELIRSEVVELINPSPRYGGGTKTGRLLWEYYRNNLVDGEMEVDDSLVRYRLNAEWGGISVPRGWGE